MCPKCREPLVVFELEGVEIDHCLSCGGTWLDEGELELITELAGVAPGPLSAALRAAPGGKHGNRRCPRCRRKLLLIHVGEPKPIELDRCKLGHGLWFDRGELSELIGRFDEGESGAVARFFGDMYRSELTTDAQGSTDNPPGE